MTLIAEALYVSDTFHCRSYPPIVIYQDLRYIPRAAKIGLDFSDVFRREVMRYPIMFNLHNVQKVLFPQVGLLIGETHSTSVSLIAVADS